MSEENVRIAAEIRKQFLEYSNLSKEIHLQKKKQPRNIFYQTTNPAIHTASDSSVTS